MTISQGCQNALIAFNGINKSFETVLSKDLAYVNKVVLIRFLQRLYPQWNLPDKGWRSRINVTDIAYTNNRRTDFSKELNQVKA